ncbi:hypothetical protein [Bacillus marasmi]|uniref:hypothetical protein n=1 Tax=Bacillus marasmi TaxID=1926279 RepID=UPI0011C6FDB6|nr:hypothetical protein [Bacillus marasmi]
MNDAAIELNIKRGTLYSYLTKRLCGFNFFLGPNSTDKKKLFYLTKDSIRQFNSLQNELENNYCTTKQLSELYSFSQAFWQRTVKKQQVLGVFSTRFDKSLRIPNKFSNDYVNKRSVPRGFISTNEIVKILDGINPKVVNNIRKTGLLGETFVGLTPDGDSITANHIEKVLELKRKIDAEVKFIRDNDYLSSREIKDIFPYDIHMDTVRKLISTKTFDDIYVRKYSYKREPVNYVKRESVIRHIEGINEYRFSTAETPIEIFNEGIQKIKIPEHFVKTADVYIDYCQNIIVRSEASVKTLDTNARKYVIRLQKYVEFFTKELTEYTDHELECVFISEHFNRADKEILINFLNHLSFVQQTKYQLTYSMDSERGALFEDEKDKVYEFSQFLDYYYYVKLYDNHIEKAINSRDYSITWLYVAIHLTNAWRHGDVIRLPKIHLKDLGITNLEYFRSNKLTDDQAGQILAQIEKHRMVKLIVSKTKFRRSFYVNKSMRIPMATAYALAQLHSDIENDEILINFKTKYNIPYDKPFNLFFQERMDLVNFSSLKMNRSLVEHLYYSIYKKKGFAYTAYEKARKIRNHKLAPDKVFSEITQIYIRQTNEDGPIDDIAVELFERGEMGYLYSLILQGVEDLEGNEISLQNETALIREFKEKYPPIILEGMAKFIQSRQVQKETIAVELLKQPKEKLNEILNKIYLGEIPAKHEDYHCLTYPQCKYTGSRSCSTCLTGIPRASVMQSLKDELEEKIDSLTRVTSWGNLLRDLSILNALLDRLKEVTVELGKGYVNEFIDLQELNIKISNAMVRVESVKRLRGEENSECK